MLPIYAGKLELKTACPEELTRTVLPRRLRIRTQAPYSGNDSGTCYGDVLVKTSLEVP